MTTERLCLYCKKPIPERHINYCSRKCQYPPTLFMSRVQKTETCWLWTGCRDKNNYGHFSGKFAHRVSYEKFKGPITKGLFVLHSCDNPPCVNPDHLSLGTAADNAMDAIARKRLRKSYTFEQISEIRALWSAGHKYSAIRKRTGISQSYLNKIVKGQWRLLR